MLIGLVVYVFITYRGPLGQFGLLFTVPGMVIGQSILALPIVVSWTAQAVENLDRRCRETLLSLGASSPQLALHTIREIRYDLGMVCVTAFGRVVTEVGVAMMLGGNISERTNTLSLEIFNAVSRADFDAANALCLLLSLFAAVIFLAAELLIRRSPRL